ncbi:hypothetical protein BGX26_009709 [Mortierella sp. AD094]|nr:hypothetical protein BGX26_009709 [Mortierella sp. AD094]
MIDLFSTLMTSIRVENRKIRFKSYPNTFLAEDAVSKLGSLPSMRSVLGADPNDPTRIITQVVTTHLSFTRDMAKNICQTFMDARLIESATDPTRREFQPRALCQITPKGAHLLAKFVYRNKMSLEDTRHLTANAIANLVYLDRADDEDAIILGQDHVDAIFKRFAGPEPNVARADTSRDPPTSSAASGRERTPSVTDLSNGIQVREQQLNSDTFKDTFYGKAAVEWLLDYATVISKEEAFCICQEMVSAGYIEQVGEENAGGRSLFRSGNSAFYQLTQSGRALAGWQSLDDGVSSINNDWMDDRTTVGPKAERNTPDASLLSAQFKLTSSNVSRLPISIARDQQRSADEGSVAGSQYNEEAIRNSTRRLSQILNDPAFQITLSEGGTMSSYAASSSGKESVGASSGGGTRMSTPSSSVQSTTSNTSRLNGILSDSTVRDLFKSFLKQNICEENLSFYLEVLDYKVKFTALINSARAYDQSVFGQNVGNNKHTYPPSLRELEKHICTQAFAIFETYLVSGAPREVNLPHQMRQDITTYMQAVVRSMETPETNGSNENKNLPPTPPSPSTPSTEASDSEKANNGGTGAPKELIHIALFDVIHDHIFRLMSTDSVPKFIKTDKYLEVVMSKHKRKNASSISSNGSSSPTSSNLEATGGLIGNYPGNKSNKTNNSGGSGGNGGEDNLSSPLGSIRNEDSSFLRRSLSLSDHRQFDPTDYSDARYGNYGGVAMDSRSRSAGMGQPSPRHVNGQVASTAATASSNANLQHLRTPRVRSASSNGSVEALYPRTPGTPGSASSSRTKPKASSGSGAGASASRQPPASLMDIYAQQQQLQGYSNQRAQLSPSQVQQMYMMRNSRSTTALPLSSSTSPTAALATPSSPPPNAATPPYPDNGTLNGTVTSNDSSNQLAKSGDQKITVLFESTSFSVEDPKAEAQQQQSPPPPQQQQQQLPYDATTINAATGAVQSTVWSPEMNRTLPGSYPNGGVNRDTNNAGMMYMDPAVMAANALAPQPVAPLREI